MNKRLILCMTAVMVIAAACTKLSGSPNDSKLVDVSFSIEDAATKSSVNVGEGFIRTFELLAYDDGELSVSYYTDRFDENSISLKLVSGKTYSFYALVNAGARQEPDLESEVRAFAFDLSSGYSALNDKGIPMCWSETICINGATDIRITLDRLVSKWRFSLDRTELPQLVVKSVKMKQVASYVFPFEQNPSAYRTNDYGDHSSTSDVRSLNMGYSVVFIVPENLQGNLLPSNSSSYGKTCDALVAAGKSAQAGLCTYLELTCAFNQNMEEPPYSGEIVYRFYLGNDRTSNFDVERNTRNEILIRPTADSPVSDDIVWEVDNSDVVVNDWTRTYSYSYTMTASPSSVSESGQRVALTVQQSEQTYIGGVPSGEPSVTDVTSWFTFSSSMEDYVSVDDNTLVCNIPDGTSGAFTAYATADRNDPDGNSIARLQVDIPYDIPEAEDVITYRYSMKASKSQITTALGSSKFTVYEQKYVNGEASGEPVDITSSALLSLSSTQYMELQSGGVVQLTDAATGHSGNATVSAGGTYEGRTIDASIRISFKVYEYELSLIRNRNLTQIGQTGYCSVMLKSRTLNGTTEALNEDYTNRVLEWSSSNSAVSVNSGVYTATSNCIEATSDGYISRQAASSFISAKVLVDNQTFDLSVEVRYSINPSSLSITYTPSTAVADGIYLIRGTTVNFTTWATFDGYADGPLKVDPNKTTMTVSGNYTGITVSEATDSMSIGPTATLFGNCTLSITAYGESSQPYVMQILQ